MTEQQQMLADMVGGLFEELGATAEIGRDWSAIVNVELTGLLVPEDHGGFGGTWDDAATVFRLAGYSAVSLPIADAIIARYLASLVGWSPTDGFGSIASLVDGAVHGDRFSGTARGVAWGRDAAYVAVPAPGGAGALLLDTAGATIFPAVNPAGEPRDALEFSAARLVAVDADIFTLGAFARAAQIAGALDAALAMSVRYVNEREQFGRPIAKFQAVQQALATFACEVAAANAASTGAAQALDRGEAEFEIAAAKLRANIAAGEGTAIAHQVHGAIGFTKEYPLHPLTRRLWSWRSDFGSDIIWSSRIGAKVAQRGAELFWSSIADRTDPLEISRHA